MTKKERERNLLQMLEKSIENDFNEMSLFTSEELGTEMDVFRVLETGYGSALTDALGEFFFRPYDDSESDVMLFSAVITLTTKLTAKYVPTLAAGIAKLNFYLPCGGFAINADETTLAFRLSQVCYKSQSDEEILRQLKDCVGLAFGAPEQYAGMLLKMAEGGVSLKELSVLFP
jgi:hypothetical protein